MLSLKNRFVTCSRLLQTSLATSSKRNNATVPPPPFPPTLYSDPAAPPARFVLMVAHQLGVVLQLRHVDLFAGEQSTAAFRQINPLQKVPTLVHGDLIIRDSHAIAIHLCEWSQDANLYPAGLDIRARIHELLFYNAGVLFPIDSTIMSEYFAGNQPPNRDLLNHWSDSLKYLELKLTENKWLSGENMSLSDLCCVATVSSMRLLIPLDAARHRRILAWSDRLKDMPCHQVSEEGLARLEDKIKHFRNI